jgi:hypothetical protein
MPRLPSIDKSFERREKSQKKFGRIVRVRRSPSAMGSVRRRCRDSVTPCSFRHAALCFHEHPLVPQVFRRVSGAGADESLGRFGAQNSLSGKGLPLALSPEPHGRTQRVIELDQTNVNRARWFYVR